MNNSNIIVLMLSPRAPAIGGITFSILNGHSFKNAFPNFLAAISGGIFAGMLICTLQ